MNLLNMYSDVPDVERYLDKIGMKKPEDLSLEYLNNLVFTHQKMIPWGNLDVCFEKKEISLEIQDIYEKVIENGREAYCVELNALFYALLKALGYDVYACVAKVLEGPPPFVIGHRGSIVRLDGKEYYCDVGFGGPMPAGAMELADGVVQSFHGFSYRMEALGYGWWNLIRLSSSGDPLPMIELLQVPIDLCDFLPISHYTCCHTQRMFNHFTDELLMNIRTEDGYASITNRILKERKGTEVITTEFQTEAELIEAMIRVFRMPETIGEIVSGKTGFLFG